MNSSRYYTYSVRLILFPLRLESKFLVTFLVWVLKSMISVSEVFIDILLVRTPLHSFDKSQIVIDKGNYCFLERKINIHQLFFQWVTNIWWWRNWQVIVTAQEVIFLKIGVILAIFRIFWKAPHSKDKLTRFLSSASS